MQTLVQVVCSKGKSLRDVITNDAKLYKFGLEIYKKQQPGRQHGWAKIKSNEPDRQGALNIEWDSDTNILLCRVINRGAGDPIASSGTSLTISFNGTGDVSRPSTSFPGRGTVACYGAALYCTHRATTIYDINAPSKLAGTST